jgi:hypothetical protein
VGLPFWAVPFWAAPFGELPFEALPLAELLLGAPLAAPLLRTGRPSGAGRRWGSGAELGLRSVTLMYRNARAA